MLGEFEKASCSVLGGNKPFLSIVCIYCLHHDVLLSEGTETFMNFRYDLHNIFSKALAVYKLYIPQVAITLVYN